jgi:hypothetical protein
MTTAYTHDNDAAIAARYLAGETGKALARAFGVTDGTIYKALERQDVPRRAGGNQPTWEGTAEERQALVAAYKAGESIRAIARRLRINGRRVTETLDEAGLEFRHPGGKRRFSDDDAAEFARAYRAGESLEQIGQRHGASYVVIRRYLLREGARLRPVGAPAFWTGERQEEAVRRYQAGEQLKDIAAAMGCGTGTLTAVLTELGAHKKKPYKRREAHHSWRGGRIVNEHGYVSVKVPDKDREIADKTRTGYVLEHRLVMARHLGRRLHRDETVHHRRRKDENELENLELWVGNHPKGQRAEDVVEWATEMLQRYAPERLR